MFWSKYKPAAIAAFTFAGLTCAGWVYSQQTTSAPANAEVVTMQEPGKPPQRFVILRTYRNSDGKTACEMRNQATGEVATYIMDGDAASEFKGQVKTETKAETKVKTSASSQGSSGTSSLLQWFKGSSANQPQVVMQERPISNATTITAATATPTPAKSEAKKTQPAPAVVPAATAMTGPAVYRTIEEPGKSSLKCRVMTTWQTFEGQKASQLQAVESGEILTIVETRSAESTPGASAKVTATLYHWGNSKTPPPGVPVPPMPSFAAAPAQPYPSAAKTNEIVAPISTGNYADGDSGKSNLVGWVRSTFGGFAPSRNAAPPAMPAMTMPADDAVSKSKSLAITEAPTKETWKAVEVAKAADVVRPADLPLAPDMPVDAAPMPQRPDPVKAPDAQTNIEAPVAPKVPEAPALIESPKVPDTAKPMPSMPQAPVSPPSHGVGVPAVETTLPNGPIPPALPASSTPIDNLPATPLPMTATPPPAPQPVAGKNVPVVSMSVPASQFGTPTKSDPIGNPESFLPTRIEEKVVAPKSAPKAPGSVVATDGTRPPLGSASVIAAGGDPSYLPVPIVTIPQGRPPMPPTAMIPAPPSAPMYANAFTPQMNQGNPPMMGYGYGSMPMPMQQMPMQPMQAPMPMMAQGYPVPMMPMQPMQPAVAYANPAMDRPGMPVGGNMSVQQCTYILQSSIYPTQREMAIDQLCACDLRANPHVVYVLLTTAKEDPAAMVRVAAVNGLTRLGVVNDAAIATYTQLKNDADPRVRFEAEQALGRATGLQPAGATNR